MYTFGNNDGYSMRGALSYFDSSALVDEETDTLIYPGENGILYLIKLNTQYDEEAGTLSIMTGGDRAIFDDMLPVLECMGNPVYVGESGSGDTVKLINNMIGGAMLAAMAEGYSMAEKAGLDLNTVFEATRGGFAGGPLYENKIPKIIGRDFEPGARIAVHYKDIVNAVHYAEETGADIPVTKEVLNIMRWMIENGYADEDQAAMIRYFEERNV